MRGKRDAVLKEDVKEVLGRTGLFARIAPKQLGEILQQKGNRVKRYPKGEFLFMEQDIPQNLFVLISGKISIATDTLSGRRILITQISKPGEMFGEVYLFRADRGIYEIYAQAEEDSVVFEMSGEVLNGDNTQLTKNLLNLFAEKAYFLSSKVRILGGDTLREKIARFIYESVRDKGNGENREGMAVTIKRETMADFLNVARPSLSRELSRMQKEGILSLQGREIRVKDFEIFEKYL